MRRRGEGICKNTYNFYLFFLSALYTLEDLNPFSLDLGGDGGLPLGGLIYRTDPSCNDRQRCALSDSSMFDL